MNLVGVVKTLRRIAVVFLVRKGPLGVSVEMTFQLIEEFFLLFKPFRTENTTTAPNSVFYYCRSFLLFL